MLKIYKGITLTGEEAKNLLKALYNYLGDICVPKLVRRHLELKRIDY